MAEIDRIRWNSRYISSDAPTARSANRWLLGHATTIDAHYVSVKEMGNTPRALDIACGAGGTLFWLAQRSWHVVGVDLSDAALQLVKDQFGTEDIADRGTFLCNDLDTWRPLPDTFDLVCCFFFLDRNLWPALRQTVRPGGLLALQTYNQGRLASRPTANPVYLLNAGELLSQVVGWGWEILDYASPPTPHATDAILARRPL